MTKTIAENRAARHHYDLGDRTEVGIVLTGSELRPLREGRCNVAELHVRVENGELWLVNARIGSVPGPFSHEETRPRKLLAKRREIARMRISAERKGMTIVALAIRFNDRGVVKLDIAEARGRNAADKRVAAAKRDWDRQKSRVMKQGMSEK